jgi:predicted enzyme related to lactoylglutathione lyase
VEVLSSRTILRPSDFEATLHFYDDVLGLSRYREYGAGGEVSGVVWFLGGGFLEATAHGAGGATAGGAPVQLWLQVADVDAEHERLAAGGASVVAPPADMAWGLREMWVADPDGLHICVVQVPDDHPLRRRV